MANSVDPDETARDEPSHLDLHCLQRYLFWSVGAKRFSALRLVLRLTIPRRYFCCSSSAFVRLVLIRELFFMSFPANQPLTFSSDFLVGSSLNLDESHTSKRDIV